MGKLPGKSATSMNPRPPIVAFSFLGLSNGSSSASNAKPYPSQPWHSQHHISYFPHYSIEMKITYDPAFDLSGPGSSQRRHPGPSASWRPGQTRHRNGLRLEPYRAVLRRHPDTGAAKKRVRMSGTLARRSCRNIEARVCTRFIRK